MNLKSILIAILMTIIPFSNSFAENKKNKQDELTAQIESLRERSHEYERYGGYPFCSEIIDTLIVDCKAILDAVASGVLKEADEQVKTCLSTQPRANELLSELKLSAKFDLKFPSDETIEQNRKYSELPSDDEPTYSVGGCFRGDTKVYRLKLDTGWFSISTGGWALSSLVVDGYMNVKKLDKTKLYTQKTDIKDVEKDQYVLSSTIGVIDDHKYHAPCWTKVTGVFKSTLAKEGYKKGYKRFLTIEYKRPEQSDKKISKLILTPLHRLYSRKITSGIWDWVEAGNLVSNGYLHLFYDDFALGTEYEIEDVYDFQANEDTDIYNLKLFETFTYYVGDPPVLVHNMKETY